MTKNWILVYQEIYRSDTGKDYIHSVLTSNNVRYRALHKQVDVKELTITNYLTQDTTISRVITYDKQNRHSHISNETYSFNPTKSYADPVVLKEQNYACGIYLLKKSN